MWTPEMSAQLLRLWPDHSASKIAALLGVTRNAVIGRYHRMHGDYDDYRSPTEQQRAREFTERRRRADERDRKILPVMAQQIAKGVSRDVAIVAAARGGASLRSIARAIGVSFQRVHQIVVAESEHAA